MLNYLLKRQLTFRELGSFTWSGKQCKPLSVRVPHPSRKSSNFHILVFQQVTFSIKKKVLQTICRYLIAVVKSHSTQFSILGLFIEVLLCEHFQPVRCQPGNFHASKKTICSSLQNGTDIKSVLHSGELVTEKLPAKAVKMVAMHVLKWRC